MAAPRKCPEELRKRAIRLAVEARRDPVTRPGALTRIGTQLGINPETLRNWVTQAEVDEGHRPGVTTEEAKRMPDLERENRELRRAKEIAVSSGERNDLGESLRWCQVAQGLAGSVIEASLDAA